MSDKKDTFETYPPSVRAAFNELEVVLPVVRRVHGDAHPELEEVGRLVGELKTGVSEGAGRGELRGILDELRKVTGGYAIPADACGGYQKECRLLSQIDAGIRSVTE